MKADKISYSGGISHLITSFILLASLLILPKVQAAVGDNFIDDNFYYTVLTEEGTSGTVSVVKRSAAIPSGEVTIPASVTQGSVTYSVTSIWDRGFQNCSNLTSITLPESMTEIKLWAFSGCSSLTNITIPDTITSIGERAFQICKNLTSITLPKSLGIIETYTFYGCTGLTNITVPDNMYYIRERAFYNCTNLTSVVLGRGFSDIKPDAFFGCVNLTEIAVVEDNPYFSSLEGVLFNKDQSTLYLCPNAKGGAYAIPEGVINIEESAFAECENLTSITIPDGVSFIWRRTFEGCSSLTSITIPNSVYYIGEEAFSRCSSLINITIPYLVPEIGSYAFKDCSSLTSIVISRGVTSLLKGAFQNCTSLKTLYFKGNIPILQEDVFKNCTALETVYYVEGTSGWSDPWKGIPATTWEPEPAGGDVFTDENFRYTVLTVEGTTGTVLLDKKTDTVYSGTVTIPSSISKDSMTYSVTRIEEKAFADCGTLTNITIPDGVTSIGNRAFENCSNLTDITIPESVTRIGNAAFHACSSLTGLVIPESVTYIGGFAFSGCSSLTSVVIPNGVTAIWSCTFSGCNSLTNITIPDSVTNIADYTFQACSSLTSITIPDSVTSIKKYAFSYCSSLTNITIPDTVTYISYGVFAGCSNLKSVGLSNSTTLIESHAFESCHNMTIITIPNTVTNIMEYAFLDCSGLSHIAFDGDAPKVEANVFKNCPKLKIICYAEGTSGWTNPWNSIKTVCLNQEDILMVKQPLNQIVLPGFKVSFEAMVFSFSALSYQWYKDGAAIEGANDAAFVIESAQVADGGSYTVRISNGYASVSRQATLRVDTERTGDPDSDFKYTLDGRVATITGYLGTNTNVAIPNIVEGCLVNHIGENAFRYCTCLTSITIPDGVTSFGYAAFAECPNLTSITLPDSLTSIGDSAFSECTSLTSITIPDNSVTLIEEWAFNDCTSLTSITIPDSVTDIGYGAFRNCTGLTKALMGNGLTHIWDYAFQACSSLSHIVFRGNAPSVEGFIFEGTDKLKNIYYQEGSSGWTNPWEYKETIGLKQEDLVIINDPVNQIVMPDFKTSFEIAVVSYSDLSYQWYKDGATIEGANDAAFVIESAQVADGGSYTVRLSNGYASADRQATLRVITERTGDPDSDFQYTLNGRVATITGYLGTNTNVAIPNIVEGCLVNHIGDNAFNGRDSLTKITIPDSIISIGASAFSGCKALTRIIIPDSVTSIGAAAFYECSELTSAVIGNGVVSIGENTFAGCRSMTSVTIGNSVTSIGEYAFNYCTNLTYVVIPDSVTSIGYNAFQYCTNLALVVFKGDAPVVESYIFYYCTALKYICYIEGTSGWTDPWASKTTAVLKQEDILIINNPLNQMVFPNTRVSIGVSAYSLSDLSYQWYKDGIAIEGATTPVFVIGSAQGADSGSYSVAISNEYASVSEQVMLRVAIERTGDPDNDFEYSINGEVVTITGYLGTKKNVVIPNIIEGCLVTSIGNSAFSNLSNLESVTIPESVTSIGDYAFTQCGHLAGIVIPDSVTFVGHDVFNSCNELTSVIFKGDAPGADGGIFNNTIALETIYYLEGTSSWTNPWNTKATAVLNQEDIIIIGSPVDQIVLQNTKVSLVVSAFSIAELSYQWHKNSAAIEGATDAVFVIESAQAEDSGSYSVTISNEYGSLSEEAKLRIIAERTGDPDSDFKYSINTGVATITGYLGTNTNMAIPNIIEGCPVTTIGSSAFYDRKVLKSITIPDTVTSIGNNAFQNCSLLTSITIPNGVTSIGIAVFSGCYGLTNIAIPNSVISIGNNAFQNCTSLIDITIPDSVISIGNFAFQGCLGITNITIPDSVTSIGASAFNKCNGLKNITISDGVTSIGASAFSSCSNLKGAVIGESVTSAGLSVFAGCSNLALVIFKGDAPTAPGIFNNTISLETIYYMEGTSGWTNPWNTKATAALKQEDIFILSAPVDQIVLQNTKVSFEVSAFSLSDLSYQWYKDGIAIEGATTPVYFIESTQGEDSGSYTVTISNEYASVSREATLNVITERIGDPDSDFKYSISDGVAIITDYLGTNVNVVIPNIIEGCLVSSIGANAFYGIYNLESITIPDTLTHIGGLAFRMCGLRTVVIGNGVTSIGMNAFASCSSLTSIIIPKNVNNIGLKAFVNCSSLASVIFEKDAPNVESDVFTGCNALSAIYYMDGTSGWTMPPWDSLPTVCVKQEDILIDSSPVNQMVLPNTEVSFAVLAYSPAALRYQWYKDGAAIEGATKPVYSIESAQGEDSGSYRITICSEYASVSKEATLRVVTERTGDPDSDFEYSINAGVAIITDYLGTNVNVVIPNIIEGCLVTRIDDVAFVGSDRLTNITIPDSVTSIGNHAFWFCQSLTSIVIPNSVTSIGSGAFMSCTGLTSIIIPDSVTSIGNSAFSGCTSLGSALFKGNAPTMGYNVFSGCDALETIYYIEGTEGWTNPWQGIATATWPPEESTTLSFEVVAGKLILTYSGGSLEASSDLILWTPVEVTEEGKYELDIPSTGKTFFRIAQ